MEFIRAFLMARIEHPLWQDAALQQSRRIG